MDYIADRIISYFQVQCLALQHERVETQSLIDLLLLITFVLLLLLLLL